MPIETIKNLRAELYEYNKRCRKLHDDFNEIRLLLISINKKINNASELIKEVKLYIN